MVRISLVPLIAHREKMVEFVNEEEASICKDIFYDTNPEFDGLLAIMRKFKSV